MKLVVAIDVAASPEHAWRVFTDVARIETELRARGVEIRRIGGWVAAAEGARWSGSAGIQGKSYPVEAELVALTPPRFCAVEGQVGSLRFCCRLEITPTISGASTLRIDLALSASSLGGKLLLKTITLSRGKLQARMEASLAAWAERAGAAPDVS